MAEEVSQWPKFRFTLEEISGSFGDSITVIPLLIGIDITTEASFAHMLLFFAVFQIVNGLFYSLPMPVEPMKALAALANSRNPHLRTNSCRRTGSRKDSGLC